MRSVNLVLFLLVAVLIGVPTAYAEVIDNSCATVVVTADPSAAAQQLSEGFSARQIGDLTILVALHAEIEGVKTVKIRLYRYGSGKWSYVRTYSAKNSNYSSYSKYKARIRLTTKAKYRFKAYTSTTTTWAGTSTGYGWTTTVR